MLVGTVSIEISEMVSKMLTRAGIKHNVAWRTFSASSRISSLYLASVSAKSFRASRISWSSVSAWPVASASSSSLMPQREVIYKQRRQVLDGEDIHAAVENMLDSAVGTLAAGHAGGQPPDHLLEHLEALALVLHHRVGLAVGPQADALAQLGHGVDVIHPVCSGGRCWTGRTSTARWRICCPLR